MMEKLVILGAGFALSEISELIDDINKVSGKYEIIAALDDNPALTGKTYDGIIVEGPLERAHDFGTEVKFVFAIGTYRTRVSRNDILKRLGIPEGRFVTLVHPTAKIFHSSQIGNGCMVHYGSVVFGHSRIGPFCVISANCVIGVGNVIGRGALLGSNVTTTTGTKIGSFGFVGSSSTISENVEIEPGAYVGMGTVVVRNVKAGTFVFGSPPRVLDRIEVSKSIIEEWDHFKKPGE